MNAVKPDSRGKREQSNTQLSIPPCPFLLEMHGEISRPYVPLKCIRATGWKGPLEFGASTTILSDLLHDNIYSSTRKAINSGRQASLHFSTKADQKMKLSAAGGNRLVCDVSRVGARWLAEARLLSSKGTNSWQENGQVIGSGVRGGGKCAGLFISPLRLQDSPRWALLTAALAKHALSQILTQIDLSIPHSLTISTAFNLIWLRLRSGVEFALGVLLGYSAGGGKGPGSLCKVFFLSIWPAPLDRKKLWERP